MCHLCVDDLQSREADTPPKAPSDAAAPAPGAGAGPAGARATASFEEVKPGGTGEAAAAQPQPSWFCQFPLLVFFVRFVFSCFCPTRLFCPFEPFDIGIT